MPTTSSNAKARLTSCLEIYCNVMKCSKEKVLADLELISNDKLDKAVSALKVIAQERHKYMTPRDVAELALQALNVNH